MLGSECKEVLEAENEVIAPSKQDLNIISWDVVIENFQKISPDIVINCAGFTDVDACEKEEYAVRKINVEGPRNLAQGSARFNCRLIHISTDYVFSGRKSIPQPYFEDDPVDPISEYGKSKVESEVAIRENAPNYLIIRSGWLYGRHGSNFISSIVWSASQKKKKKIKIVEDQFGSPTWTYRLALQIKELLKVDLKGTFHATSEGFCSRLECAEYIFKKLKIKIPVEACTMKSLHKAAKRPVNCILENRLLKKRGLNVMKDWRKDLDIFLERYGKELITHVKLKKT
jgi:dTDP-4-dehydrorhamnose reductase